MEIAEFALDETVSLLLVKPDETDTSAPVLSPAWDAIVEAYIGGVSVPLTIAALKDIAGRLRKRGVLPDNGAVDAQSVTDAVREYLTRAGATAITFDDVRRDGDLGWSIHGEADGRNVTAQADPNGQVIQVTIV